MNSSKTKGEAMKSSNKRTSIKWLPLILLATSHGAIFRVAYLNSTFYPALRAALDITNEQIGILTSVYGTAAIFFYAIGGLVADKFKAKHCVGFGLIGTALTTIWYSTMPSYETLMVIFLLLSFFNTLLFWSPYLKVIRSCGNSEDQGKVFGIDEGVSAVSSTTCSLIVVAIINGASTELSALVSSLKFYAIIYFIFGILALIFLGRNEKSNSDEKSSRIKLSELAKVYRYPSLYLCSIIVFCAYSIYGATSYIIAFLTDVWNVESNSLLVSFAGVFRAHGIGIIAAPVAGILADKIGSPTRWIRICMCVAVVCVLSFSLIPESVSIAVPLILMTVLGTFCSFMNGTYFATMNEAKLPIEFAGTSVGVISALGFLPDAFMYRMMGKWIDDNPGITGYRYIFYYLVIVCIIAFFACTLLLKLKKQNNQATTE